MGIYVTGCTCLVFELNQEKGSEGTINIFIHTYPDNNDNVDIFIDNVQVDMDEVWSLAKAKKNTQKAEPIYQIYGTF
jgi:hypothetical protein